MRRHRARPSNPRGARRVGRGAVATLGVVAAVLPLVAVGGASAVATPALAVPGTASAGRAATTLDDACSVDTPKLINQVPPALLQLGYQTANTIATGKGVVVAVVDSGVDATNVHLQGGAVLPGVDVSGAGAANGQQDLSGHGTAIAGEIAARPVSGSGVVGLAPDATILPIRSYVSETTNGSTPQFPPSVGGIALGINAAVAAGAKIINVSMSTTTNDPFLQAAVEDAARKGALVVASAGNRNTTENKADVARYPAAYPDALAVAAVDGSGQVTDDSIHGSYVDVAAPGVDVITAYRNAGDCQLATDNASTSYATAYVSATAALVAQAHPDETPAQWRYRIEATALRVRPDTRDDYAGWGVIQPYEALTFVSDGTAAGPPDPAVTRTPTTAPAVQQIAPVLAGSVDTTERDQTLWITLGAVVGVLLLALLGLLRRDRKKSVSPPPRTPAGVR